VDGERIEGTWRPIFIRNGRQYFLADLLAYADGMIDCWELVNLEEFAAKVSSGWVATDLPDGAQASAYNLATWKFTDPHMWLTPQMLLSEVRDEIDRLGGRPDSTDRCMSALDVFRSDPTEENRAMLREAYEAIPEHMRIYALGDQDSKDWPLQAVIAGPANPLTSDSDDESVTEEEYAAALKYFADQDQERQVYEVVVSADGPTEPVATSILITQTWNAHGWFKDAEFSVLRNEFPTPFNVDGQTYPTVTHAYWALSVTDERQRAEILQAERPYDAQKLAETFTRREDWHLMRTAVMADLLRAKFSQHPDHAAVLISTGATRLIYTELGSTYWGQSGLEGRNWTGRLLELVRSELALRAQGTPSAR
jgi:ribA/ribD-fused uncharacterized protein